MKRMLRQSFATLVAAIAGTIYAKVIRLLFDGNTMRVGDGS